MKKFNSVLSKTFILIMALITLFPFVYMILASFMTYQEATSIPPTLIPEKFNWSNFSEAMKQAPFVRYFFNTILVSGISTIGTVLTSVLAAFALVKLEFRYKLSNNCTIWIIKYIHSFNSSITCKCILYILSKRVFN